MDWFASVKSNPIISRHLHNSDMTASQTHTPCPRAVTGRTAQELTNEHTIRSQRYYDTQKLRPNVPVFPQPNAEDIARRSRSSGVPPVRLDPFVRKALGLGQCEVADIEDITSDLRPTLPSQSNGNCRVHCAQHHHQGIDIYGRAFISQRPDGGDMHPTWTRDEMRDGSVVSRLSSNGAKKQVNEEQSLGGNFEMVEFDNDLTEGFEEVNRDIPTAFNGNIPR